MSALDCFLRTHRPNLLLLLDFDSNSFQKEYYYSRRFRTTLVLHHHHHREQHFAVVVQTSRERWCCCYCCYCLSRTNLLLLDFDSIRHQRVHHRRWCWCCCSRHQTYSSSLSKEGYARVRRSAPRPLRALSPSLLRVKSRECNRVQKYDDDFKRKKMKRCDEGTKKKKNRFARGRGGTRAKPEMCFSFDLFDSM